MTGLTFGAGGLSQTAPAELATQNDQHDQQCHSQRALSDTAGKEGSGHCAGDSSDQQLNQQREVVVPIADLETAADQGDEQSKTKIGANHGGGGESW